VKFILKRKKKQYYKNEIVSSLLTQIQNTSKFDIKQGFLLKISIRFVREIYLKTKKETIL